MVVARFGRIDMLEEANAIRERRALENKWFLYNYIARNPGLTVYELGKRLKWSVGKIHYYIKALLEEGMIQNSTEIVGGRVRKSYSSTKVKEFLNLNEINQFKKNHMKGAR